MTADRFVVTSSGQSLFQGMPWEFDLLEQDLGARYPDFSQGQPVCWGLLVSAIDNSWAEEAIVKGLDWQGRFYPPKTFKIPLTRPQRWQAINRCCFLVVVDTKQTDMNVARDTGRKRCRALLALARREYPTIEVSSVIWEGAIAWPRPNKMRMTAARSDLMAAERKSARLLQRVGLRMSKLELDRFTPQLIQALEWLTLARSAEVRAEKFMHMWYAVLALASYRVSRKKGDMGRIKNYTSTMGTGVAGVRSRLSIADLNLRFGVAYKARNLLVHQADISLISLDLLKDLELAAFELIDFELAKLKMQLMHG